MPRLTVSVPQDLHQRLDRWRDTINISRICQEALERELKRMEELPEDARALEDLVARLSKEKSDGDRRWFSQGVADGMSWAHGAAYLDLRATAEESPEATPEARAALRKAMSPHRGQLGFDSDSYISGWRFAASEVWHRVKNKL